MSNNILKKLETVGLIYKNFFKTSLNYINDNLVNSITLRTNNGKIITDGSIYFNINPFDNTCIWNYNKYPNNGLFEKCQIKFSPRDIIFNTNTRSFRFNKKYKDPGRIYYRPRFFNFKLMKNTREDFIAYSFGEETTIKTNDVFLLYTSNGPPDESYIVTNEKINDLNEILLDSIKDILNALLCNHHIENAR